MKNVGILALILILLAGLWLALSDGSSATVPLEETPESEVEEAPDMRASEEVVPERKAVSGARGAAESSSLPNSEEPVWRPRAGRGALRLKVTYEDGSAAVGVQVLCSNDSSWNLVARERTDQKGEVLFRELQPGSLYAKTLRGGESAFGVAAGRVTEGRIKILRGVSVAAEVVDAAGAPVADAQVWLSERWRTNRGGIAGRTDDRGRLELAHVSPHCQLAVRAKGYAPSRLYPVQGSPGSHQRVRVVLGRGGGKVSGRVVDPQGQPVAEALVLLGIEDPAYSHRNGDGSWVPGAPPTLRRTGADGRFAAEGVPKGQLVLQVRHPDYAPFKGEIEALPGGGPPREVVLTPSAVLFGQLLDGTEKPVGFGQVRVGKFGRFSSRHVQADARGRFEMRGVPVGELSTTARFRELRAEERLVFRAGVRTEWNPTLRDPAETSAEILVGRVVDHANEPLKSWRVVGRGGESASETVSCRTDATGKFRLRVNWPSLRVFVHAPREHSGFPALVRDDVRPDQGELLLQVDLPERRAAEVLGTVVDAVGQPVQTQIQAWHQDLKLWRQFRTDGKTGAFHIKNLPPGRLDLKIVSAQHPWRALPQQTLTAGQRLDLGPLALENGGRIEGGIRFAGQPATGVQVRLFDVKKRTEAGVAEVTTGRYRTGVLATGTYSVQVKGRGFVTASHTVAVTAGSVARHSFALQRAAVRVLRFQVPAGVPTPRYMSLICRHKNGAVAWNGGVRGGKEMEVEVSLAPGQYRLSVYGPGSIRWLTTELSVTGFAETSALEFTVRPER